MPRRGRDDRIVRPVLNHVSIVAHDLEMSLRFYVDELGLAPLPTPNFGFPVVWLTRATARSTSSRGPGEPPSHAHFGLEIAEFMPVYLRMKELGVLDHETFGNAMYELPDGGIQMYVRDPAGNLVELDHRDASTIPVGQVPEYVRLADLRPQEGEAARATLWHTARVRYAPG